MRNAFVDEIFALAEADERVVMVTADIGNRLFDRFKARFPKRFFNCGVAEANMTGVAAGLASCGLRPFTYTITPFATTRCLEQIRVDLCYHQLPVTVVGVGAGYAYASLGATHHACEDISFLRSLPGMAVVCPGDAKELRALMRCLPQRSLPTYLRLGKKGEPVVHADIPPLEIGKAYPLRSGQDLCLLSTGNMLPEAQETGRLLAEAGLDVEITSLHTVKPLDEAYLQQISQRFSLIVTIEEHSLIGGLGAAIAEWICDLPARPLAQLLRLGTPDSYPHHGGSQEYFRREYGLTAPQMAEKILHRFRSCSA